MRRWRWGMGLVVLCLGLLLATSARADRVPSSKAYYPTFPGVRPQIEVPYTTNGGSTLGVYQGVAPRIYNSPNVADPQFTGSGKPVFNLIFYGSSQGYGDASNGAQQRPPNELRPQPGK
jgi:hypothetical protein